jgi:hypothetical protein
MAVGVGLSTGRGPTDPLVVGAGVGLAVAVVAVLLVPGSVDDERRTAGARSGSESGSGSGSGSGSDAGSGSEHR